MFIAITKLIRKTNALSSEVKSMAFSSQLKLATNGVFE
jgi:hypothetical protein